MRRVLLVGATGAFGSRLAALLAKQPDLHLILAARRRAPLDALRKSLGTRPDVSVALLDREPPDLAGLAPWLLVDARARSRAAIKRWPARRSTSARTTSILPMPATPWPASPRRSTGDGLARVIDTPLPGQRLPKAKIKNGFSGKFRLLTPGNRELSRFEISRELMDMNIRKTLSVSLLALGTLAFAAPAFAKMDMKAIDPDSDGTVSLAEAQDAAAKKFAAMDPDNDGTIDLKEAKGKMAKAKFKKTDADNDGTVDKAEYSALVESAFKAADPDGDGTLDAKELKTPAGQKLLSLIQ